MSWHEAMSGSFWCLKRVVRSSAGQLYHHQLIKALATYMYEAMSGSFWCLKRVVRSSAGQLYHHQLIKALATYMYDVESHAAVSLTSSQLR